MRYFLVKIKKAFAECMKADCLFHLTMTHSYSISLYTPSKEDTFEDEPAEPRFINGCYFANAGFLFQPDFETTQAEWHKLWSNKTFRSNVDLVIEMHTLLMCAYSKTIFTMKDESLDALFGCEEQEVNINSYPYYRILEQHNVVGNKEAFLDDSQSNKLFAELKKCTDIIKANTDKPHHTRNSIWKLIAQYDNIPYWGLFYQILILVGLHTTLDDNTSNYLRADIEIMLRDKLWHLYNNLYTKGMAEKITPLIELLEPNPINQLIQLRVKQEHYPHLLEPQPEAETDNKHSLPDNVIKYFNKAIDAGYMKQTPDGYKWLKGGERGNVQLACFILKIYGNNPIPFNHLEKIFGVKRLDCSMAQISAAKKPQKWLPDIDKLFL